HLRVARDAADRMLKDVADRLKNVPKMGGVRKDLLRQAVRIYEGFLSEHADDHQVRLEAATTYRKLGRIHLDMGESDKSNRAYGEAVSLMRALVTERPDDLDCRRELAACVAGLADIQAQRRSRPTAERGLREAVLLREQIAAAPGANDHDRLDMAHAYW